MNDWPSRFLLAIWLGAVCGATAAEPRWAIEKRTGRFSIHSDGEFEGQDLLLEEMRQVESGVAKLLGITLGEKTVHVVLFGSEREYRRYMEHYFPKLPARRALYIQDRGPGMLFAHRHDELRTDLRHECVHALLNDRGRPLPLWLDEGLAEYFEVSGDKPWNLHQHLAGVQQRINMGFVPSIEELERLETTDSMGPGQYRDSWAWVHFLLHRKLQTRELVCDFVRRQRAGEALPPLSRTLAISHPDWRSEFVEHFRALR